ncbi:gamma subclass chorismate mutase AroQ [Streptomyces sp. P6-2-1]|uniref:gamma subclass chorismate mutase AroQ n=1 Tax=Streptomyces sp. P6-2-1 TaxID=3422591 RepID=UPI003D35CCE8
MLTGLLVSATALTAPHAVAAGTDPVGRLGPLTGLVVERLRVSDDVAASKYATGSPVDDPAREAQVLRQVREQAAAAGGDPDAAAAFFRDQIAASKTVQKGLLARWTARPAEAPRTQPDLGRTRAARRAHDGTAPAAQGHGAGAPQPRHLRRPARPGHRVGKGAAAPGPPPRPGARHGDAIRVPPRHTRRTGTTPPRATGRPAPRERPRHPRPHPAVVPRALEGFSRAVRSVPRPRRGRTAVSRRVTVLTRRSPVPRVRSRPRRGPLARSA